MSALGKLRCGKGRSSEGPVWAAVPVVQRVGAARMNAGLTRLPKARASLDHSFLELDKNTAERVVRPVTRRLFRSLLGDHFRFDDLICKHG